MYGIKENGGQKMIEDNKKKWPWAYSEKIIKEAKNLYNWGYSYPVIAKKLGIQRWMTVYDWKKKFDSDNEGIRHPETIKKREETAMGLTQDITKIWNAEVVRREVITSTWMQQRLNMGTNKLHPKNRISAVFHRFIKKGCARKGPEENSYRKLKNFKPRRIIPKLTENGLLDTSFEKKDQQKTLPTSKTLLSGGELVESAKIKPTDSIDLLTLGKAWDALTDDLKAQVTELRKQLSEERKTIGELVEEKRHLEELYKQAQTKILELNTGGKGKTLSLSELQDFRDELPE